MEIRKYVKHFVFCTVIAASCILSGVSSKAAVNLKDSYRISGQISSATAVSEKEDLSKVLSEANKLREKAVQVFSEGENVTVSDPSTQDPSTQDPATQDPTAQNPSTQDSSAQIPVYSGGSVYGLQEIAATTTSATISWQPAYGAIGYVVAEFDGANYTPVQTVQDTTFYSIYPEDSALVLAVFPVDGNGAIGDPSRVLVSTLPKKINNVDYAKFYSQNKLYYFADNNKLMVSWNESLVAYGYEAVCYNKKGKVVQKVDVSYQSSTPNQAVFTKTNTKNIYYVVVRGYTLVNGGAKKIYGQASNKFYAVPQPDITSSRNDVTKTSVNMKWKKVKGATSYTVYMSNKQNSGFKKIATVKKNSLKITKFRGKTLNTLNGYYIKVITNAKFKKKKVKSKGNYMVKAYSYYTY